MARAARLRVPADVAQLVEHITRNDGVRGSSPRVGFPGFSPAVTLGYLAAGPIATKALQIVHFYARRRYLGIVRIDEKPDR